MAGGGIKMNYIAVRGGADGKTPVVKVENGDLYSSYDNWETKSNLGRVKGEDGEQGEKGATGAKIISQTLVGQSGNGGNIYLQTFDDGTQFTFTAPKGEKGETGSSKPITYVDLVLDDTGYKFANSDEFTNILNSTEPTSFVMRETTHNTNGDAYYSYYTVLSNTYNRKIFAVGGTAKNYVLVFESATGYATSYVLGQGVEVVQETGGNTTVAMSQDATTKALREKIDSNFFLGKGYRKGEIVLTDYVYKGLSGEYVGWTLFRCKQTYEEPISISQFYFLDYFEKVVSLDAPIHAISLNGEKVAADTEKNVNIVVTPASIGADPVGTANTSIFNHNADPLAHSELLSNYVQVDETISYADIEKLFSEVL